MQYEALTSLFMSSCVAHLLSGNHCPSLFSCRSFSSFWSDIAISSRRRVSRPEIHNEESQIALALSLLHCNITIFSVIQASFLFTSHQTQRLDDGKSGDSSPSTFSNSLKDVDLAKECKNALLRKFLTLFKLIGIFLRPDHLDNSSM